MYIVGDTGTPGNGERVLPDDVDTLTDMRWEAVVACYQGNIGAVYVDENPAQNSAFGFKEVYFNSELDAVELSISRQALRDAGWNGLSIASLNFQVFTTRDGVCNGCNGGGPGLGDIGGRSDVRDAIFNDFLAEDLINTGSGSGYHRALDAHDVFQQPLNLHVTPTLASAIEWAAVDPAKGTPWRDGPTFNDRISELASSNVAQLMASTFSDHVMPYFTTAYTADNVAQADEFLNRIYGIAFNGGTTPFWTPERVVDADVFGKILGAGYTYTVITLMKNWEAFQDADDALAYDYAIRWIANRPWVVLVGLEDIAAGEVDITGDGTGDNWCVLDRGSPTIDKVAHDFIHHASSASSAPGTTSIPTRISTPSFSSAR